MPAPARAADEPLSGIDSQLDLYKAAAEAAPCDLDWALLGGIAGFVSDHGRIYQTEPLPPLSTIESIELSPTELANRIRAINPVAVPIRGEALDGADDRLLVEDTDDGRIDGDPEFDRAVGPFQFIPLTWQRYATDANGDERADPDDIVDAAAAAAWFLCDLDADADERTALSGYFGTSRWNSDVAEARAELIDFERRARPAAEVAGIDTDADVPLVSAGGITVHLDIGDVVQAMVQAAADDGVELRGWGWRSHERQIELRAAHCDDIWETPSSQCMPPTAKPGDSLHEIGLAIDFFTGSGEGLRAISADSPEFVWLQDHAAEHGFINLPSEPWHWSTTGG